jgi:hypothetical protein
MFEDEGNAMAFLSFQLINKGLAPLSNVSIRVEGPFSAVDGNFHVGTMAPGDVEFFEDSIILFEFGEIKGDIVIEYEDATGTPGELRVPISAFASEPFVPDEEWGGDEPLPFPPGEEDWVDDTDTSGALLWWHWAIIIGGSVIIIGSITLGVVRRIRRKRREAEDFDE